MHSLTKIMASVGPACEDEKTLEAMIKAGVNLFRMNTKHQTVEANYKRMKTVRKVIRESGENVGILLDIQGAQLRIETRDGEEVPAKKGDLVHIGRTFDKDTPLGVHVVGFYAAIQVGDTILFEDGKIQAKVVEVRLDRATLKVTVPGIIKNNKNMNCPGRDVVLPPLTRKDKEYLDALIEFPLSHVALSFVREARDIKILRKELEHRSMSAQIVAKIENMVALRNLEEIVEATDAVMIARGDLGVEVPLEQLAVWQKEIVTLCRKHRRPVIVATEMLQSMVDNPRPTRAETTDVANAVYDGADSVMLSAETTTGNYPVESVEMMKKIVAYAEKYKRSISMELKVNTGADLVSQLAHNALGFYDADKIIVFTATGYTAYALASLRPNVPIIAITNQKEVVAQLSLVYGVQACYHSFPSGIFSFPNPITTFLQEKKILRIGEKIMVIHGYHEKNPEMVNGIAFSVVGE